MVNVFFYSITAAYASVSSGFRYI